VTDKFAAQHEAQMKINVETVSALNGLRRRPRAQGEGEVTWRPEPNFNTSAAIFIS
jgi:hypothetical protein